MKILNPRQTRKITEMAVTEMAKYIKDAGIKTIVLGISGGLDSAVMAVLGLRTIDKLRADNYECSYIYDFLDIESQPDDLKKARVLAHECGFELGEHDYTDWYRQSPIRLSPHLELPKVRVAKGNLKCRIRMLHLYDRAQLYDGIVLDTDDLSELLMGFWTRHGDVGDIKVIQHLTKDEVRDLGEYLGITKLILGSAPGDGLGVTDTNLASDQLRMDYLKIDYIMSRLVHIGFDYNGSRLQLKINKYTLLMAEIAKEIKEPLENVLHVAGQSLRTAHKRKYGDDVANLLPNRSEMGLAKFGSGDFNSLYSFAIKKSL